MENSFVSLSTVAHFFPSFGRLGLLSTATLERFNKKQIAGGKHGSDFFINTHIYTHSYYRPSSMMNTNASLNELEDLDDAPTIASDDCVRRLIK